MASYFRALSTYVYDSCGNIQQIAVFAIASLVSFSVFLFNF
jgi:hypothetical protein